MSLYAHYAALLDGALDALESDGSLPAGVNRRAVAVEPPRDPAHGDLATNAAMVLAKAAGTNPRALAGLIAPKIEALPDVTAVEVAGPGFINIRLSAQAWRAELETILREGDGYGRSTIGAGERVNVEYVSANPTGPMHMGHCRGAVVGDSLANLLESAGYAVTREYYVNDAGSQVDTLARSAHLRYREALGEDVGPIPEGFYPGDYLVPVGEALAKEFGDRYRWHSRSRVAGLVQGADRGGDARPDPPRSRPARNPPRRVRVGSGAAGNGRCRPRRSRRFATRA